MSKTSRTTKEIYKPYKPDEITKKMLKGAWQYIKSLEYQPGGREVFYNLFDRGFFSKRIRESIQRAEETLTDATKTQKQKEKARERLKFIKAKPKTVANRYYINYTSNARRRFYEGWTPDTFCDDSRSIIEADFLYFQSTGTVWNWIDDNLYIERTLEIPDPPYLGKFLAHQTIVEVWYEASANTDFFKTYTKRIILRPFGGQYSIEKKWQAYEQIRHYNQQWPDKDVHILYFGDLDPNGKQIPETAVENIRAWGEVKGEPVNFEFHRVGLLEEHIKKFNLPDNPDKLGEFQWEAMSADNRKQLVKDAMKKYIRVDEQLLKKIKKNEDTTGRILNEELENFGYSAESEEVEDSDEFKEKIIKRLKTEKVIEDRE